MGSDISYKNELEFMAYILNCPNAMSMCQIKPPYFSSKEIGKIFQYIIECYNENGLIDLTTILKKHPNDLDTTLYIDMWNDVLIHNDENWLEYFNLKQIAILNTYKESVIRDLNDKLKDGKMDYNDFCKKINKIQEININAGNDNRMLTIKDINVEDEEKTFVKSGINQLDNLIGGFILGEMSVWSGSNGSAKSTFINQMAIESINQGNNTAIFSGELRDKRLVHWVSLQCAGKKNISFNSDKFYYFVNSYAKNKILKWLDGKLFIYNNKFGNNANEIIQSVRNCVKKNKIKTVVLDNLMSMNLASYGEQKYDMQTKLMNELSALAKELDIHIHFICHPRKSVVFLRKEDISGSADLTNIADNVFILHRVNHDFEKRFGEAFDCKSSPLFDYDNVVEIAKNREFGIQDEFIGMYFEKESKRLLNSRDEEKTFKWSAQID